LKIQIPEIARNNPRDIKQERIKPMSTTNQQRFQEITDKICQLLEQGKIPWRKTWHGEADCPTSISTGKPYHGINRVMLLCNFQYSSSYYLTYDEAVRRGGYVKKGEKGTTIYFWKWLKVRDKDTGEEKEIPFMKTDHVFNLEQTENVKFNLPETTQNTFEPIEHAQELIDGWSECPPISHHGDRTCYIPAVDRVEMPKPESFDTNEYYYQVLFHELTHSTGNAKRLNRHKEDQCIGHFGDQDYSREELVAELGAAFLCSECQIDNSTIENSAAYIQSWLKSFKNDPAMVYWAATRAQKAVDYIIGKKIA
jgi:antirestriction protein ArdC